MTWQSHWRKSRIAARLLHAPLLRHVCSAFRRFQADCTHLHRHGNGRDVLHSVPDDRQENETHERFAQMSLRQQKRTARDM